MSTKTINTRIGLKYDLYANWAAVEESFVPNKGEVIFYEIPATTGAVAQEPAILFKVGDGNTTLKDLPWGSAIAADVYAWAKQQSLLGGTYSEGTEGAAGTWTWSTDNAYKQEQDEVAAFIKKETANIKIKVEQLDGGENAGKYQTYISNDGGTSWEATGNPFEIELTDYSAGNGISLDGSNNFSIKLKEGEDNLVVATDGLSAKVAQVTYTAASTSEGTTTAANLTVGDTTGLLDETAVGAIKSYVDAKADASTVTVEKLTTAEIGYASSYVVKQNGTQVGATINIPKDYLVKSASLETCTTADTPVQGLKVGDKYIDFVVNTVDGTGTESHIYLPVKDLVDVYTGEETTFISVSVDDNNKITATAKTQLISGASGRTYTFTSYSAATDGTQYSTGKVEVVKVEGGKTYVKVIENNPDTDFVGNVYYVNSVFETELPEGRLQLNDNSGPIDVWVQLTGFDGSDVDGLATALDVKRYVGEQLAANVPNVGGQEAIVVTTAEGTTSKTVSLKLHDTEATTGEDGEVIPANVSGLKQSDAGLEIDDTIEWILNCGGAPTIPTNDNQEQQ